MVLSSTFVTSSRPLGKVPKTCFGSSTGQRWSLTWLLLLLLLLLLLIQYELTAPQRGLQFHCSRLRSWSRDQVDPSPPHPLFSMQAYLSLFATRCTFFFFWCHKNHEEPEDPNTCPYKSVEAMLHHIKSQPKWIEWRNAPLEKRPSLARNITKHFHPDKWDEFNPTCDIDHKGALPRTALPRCESVAKTWRVIVFFAGKWAETISQSVIDLIMKDRDEMKKNRK